MTLTRTMLIADGYTGDVGIAPHAQGYEGVAMTPLGEVVTGPCATPSDALLHLRKLCWQVAALNHERQTP